MKILHNCFGKMSLRLKWLYLNLLSNILFIAIIAVAIYFIIFVQLKAQYTHSASQNFDLASVSLVNKLNDYQQVAQTFANNTSLRQYVSTDSSAPKTNTYLSRQSLYQYITKYYTRLQYTYKLDDIVIYTLNGYLLNNMKKEDFSSEQLESSDWYQYTVTTGKTGFFYSYHFENTDKTSFNDDLYYYEVIDHYYNSSKFGGAIRLTIPYEKIYSIINVTNLTENGFSLIVDSYQHILLSTDNNFENDTMKSVINQLLADEKGSSTVSFGNAKYFAQKKALETTSLYLISFMPYNDIYASYYDFQIIFLFICILAVIISIYSSKKMSVIITSRLSLLMDSLLKASTGVFAPIQISKYNDDITLSIKSYNKILTDLQQLIKTQQENAVKLRNYEFSLLLEQINPHFLYNTLELINSLALKNNEAEISTIVQYLADYYKLTLNDGKTETTLDNELRHAEHYLNIQNKRFDRKISLIIDVPNELLNTKVIKIFLQPIIENSIYHGFIPKKDNTDNEIVILVYQEDFLYIEITDNGLGIPPEKLDILLSDSSNFALTNINDRLKLFYGSDCGLSVKSQYGEYTTVIIKIKLFVSPT